MEKRTSRRSFMKEENTVSVPVAVAAVPETTASAKKRQIGRPKKVRNVVGVPPTIPESPTNEANVALLKNMKEPSIVLHKLSTTSAQKPPAPATVPAPVPETTARPKRATRASATRSIKAVKETAETEDRVLASRQSSVSTVPTVDLNASNDGADMLSNPTTMRLNEYIKRSASRTLEEATNVIRRSLSRAPSQAATGSDMESVYTRSVSHDVDEYSDDERDQYTSLLSDKCASPATTFCRPPTIPSEFGGAWLQALLLLLVPLLTTYLVMSAGNHKLSLPKNNDYLKLIKQVFPTSVVLTYLYFQLSLFIMSGVLVSWKVRMATENNAVEWSFNALPMAVCTNLALAALAYYGKFNVVNFVLQHEWRLCIMALVHAFITAFWCHLRAVYAGGLHEQINLYGRTGNIITDFALGRFINPKAFNIINYKQYAYRAQLITTLLLAECYLIKNIAWPNLADLPTDFLPLLTDLMKLINLQSGVFCAGCMLLMYVIDNLVYERHLASSFELQAEGFGCLTLLRYAATPYLLSGFVRYSHKQKLLINCSWIVYVALAVFAIGWSIKRLSSAQKYKYRLNPGLPIFYNMETIHTHQGCRLLSDGFWGKVRQPNYAGDILALISLCLPFVMKWNIWPAHVGILLIIITIVHRALRVNERNQQRYNSSWVRYRHQVRHYIVPKIF